MVHTFATHEEAAIFASAMRAKGYHAEILDEGMASVYGPLTIGGIRVLVSKESAGNDDGFYETDAMVPPPPGAEPDGEILRLVRLLVVGVAALGLIILVILLLSAYSRNPGGLLWVLIEVLIFPLIIGLAFALMGPFMGSFTRFVRGEPLAVGWKYLRWLLLALIIPYLLLAVL
jgi:hypothetical protein